MFLSLVLMKQRLGIYNFKLQSIYSWRLNILIKGNWKKKETDEGGGNRKITALAWGMDILLCSSPRRPHFMKQTVKKTKEGNGYINSDENLELK